MTRVSGAALPSIHQTPLSVSGKFGVLPAFISENLCAHFSMGNTSASQMLCSMTTTK
eukprot:CAMPEP_0206626432 /NCGR_PEP_ID=MMETSP0325_2-20121206/65288_1 /ASSEMBLY_ACC=CAM_ASM_000347 /TAXON_ID=2866 /ORGANISM="Crypthecodinium cohnii, Strain Seligo" /LENGTH=56 /DNA_ID=CAMNT_0054150727 /DNA_START=225 /DNA_END=395 /DNA_ORIENTATION=+